MRKDPFTFIKNSYNHETLLDGRKLEKLEIQLAKSRTARIFNLRCLANKVTLKMKFYKQSQGAAMGSPVFPVIAIIYMDYFESLAIPLSPTLIKWWFRFVDDLHSATRKDQVNQLQEHPNYIDPHIKWTPLPRYPDQTHS